MKIFKDYTLSWWQMGIFKLSLLAIGIAIGANWPQVFVEYTTILVIIGVILGAYLGYVSWLKK